MTQSPTHNPKTSIAAQIRPRAPPFQISATSTSRTRGTKPGVSLASGMSVSNTRLLNV